MWEMELYRVIRMKEKKKKNLERDLDGKVCHLYCLTLLLQGKAKITQRKNPRPRN